MCVCVCVRVKVGWVCVVDWYEEKCVDMKTDLILGTVSAVLYVLS